MQNSLHQPKKGRRKQVLVEKKDLENFSWQSQNLATELKCLKRQYSEIQDENGRKEAKKIPVLTLETIRRLSAKEDREGDVTTSKTTDEKAADMELTGSNRIKTVHMKKEIEGLCQRAKAYVRLIQPDQEYVKFGPENNEMYNWPFEIEGYVRVTNEDNNWRKEFKYQERVPEGTFLLRPWVTMSILVAMIICQSPDKMLMAKHIYGAIQRRFPYFLYMPKKEQLSWKGSIRKLLSEQKWFSKVEFPSHSSLLQNNYWTFNCDTNPDNWNLSARSIRTAIKPMDKTVLKEQGSNREAGSILGKNIMLDLQGDQTKHSDTEPTTTAMTLSQPESSITNTWDINLPSMPNYAQNVFEAILYEEYLESGGGLTEI